MYHPAGIDNTNNYVAKTPPKSGIPKILTYFFYVLAFVFGMDFGFIKLLSPKIQRIASLFTLILSLLVMYVLTEPFIDDKRDIYWCCLILMQYTCNFLVLKSAKYTVCDFLLDLNNIDNNITYLCKVKIGVATWMYGLFMYVSKFVVVYYSCTVYFPEVCVMRFVPFYIYTIWSMSVDLMSVAIISIYFYLYYYVGYLNELLNESDSSLLLLKDRYMAIADCYDKIRPLYQKLKIVELMFEVPKTLGDLWNLLSLINENAGWFAYLGELIFVVDLQIHLFCSAAVVQMVSSQVESLKLKLHNMIVDEQDMKRHGATSRLVVYMEARQLQHKVLGVVPVDLRLPMSVISICATYLIVSVQFTHLYD